MKSKWQLGFENYLEWNVLKFTYEGRIGRGINVGRPCIYTCVSQRSVCRGKDGGEKEEEK